MNWTTILGAAGFLYGLTSKNKPLMAFGVAVVAVPAVLPRMGLGRIFRPSIYAGTADDSIRPRLRRDWVSGTADDSIRPRDW